MKQTTSLTTGRLVIAAAVLGAVVFGSVNIMSASLLRSARLDLTQQKLYSLSQGTKTLIGQIQEPIRFRFSPILCDSIN